LKSPIGDKQRGGPKPRASLFSSSSTGAHVELLQTELRNARFDLTFIRA
jgi:hypothetical protein